MKVVRNLLRHCGAACFTAAVSCSALAQQPPGAAPLSPDEQKARDLRGPGMREEQLSTLTPAAREKSGFAEVSAAESNRFGMGRGAEDKSKAARPLTEEQKIRSVLSNLRISGLSGSPGSYRALLGPLVVAEGEMVPRLFADQAEQLKVVSISDRSIVLEFVEKQAGGVPRIVTLPLDLGVQVDSLLVGEMFGKLVPLNDEGVPELPALTNQVVDAITLSIEQEDLEPLVDRKTELLNAPANPESDEEPEEE